VQAHWIRAACLALYSAALFSLSSCGKTQETSAIPPDPATPPKITIGFSLATLKEDRWLRDRDIFSAKAQEQGYDVIVTNANNDSALQLKQVKDLIKQHISILVIVPNDAAQAADCVAEARSAGIPAVSYDRLVMNADVSAYVSFDNVEVGRLEGQYMLSSVPSGGILILNGSADDHNSAMFNQGYMDALQDAVSGGRITILGQTWVQNWTREIAHDYVKDAIAQYGDRLNGIIAADDSLAWGAIDALSEAQLSGKVKVVGEDADLAACQHIVQGTQLMTVYKPIKNLVEQTLSACELLLGGKPLIYSQTIGNGRMEVPYISCGVTAVTKSNMDTTVIQDGFQLRNDVYGSSGS